MLAGRPLAFAPVYQRLIWGGRRMERFRSGLPEGPIGESWDLADHDKGMSVVSDGELSGQSLRELTGEHGAELVGRGFRGAAFPLMVKLIDASDKLSVQVHPDDALAKKLGVGDNGKTECWFMLDGGGELYQGTVPGVDRRSFRDALAGGRIAELLNRYEVEREDFFFLDARTVHALGAGCLLYEIQQTSDVTFRVYDWDRVGLDGKPRPLHVEQSLDTIDFSRTGFGPQNPPWRADARGGRTRRLADCAYFELEHRKSAEPLSGGKEGTCSIVVGIAGNALLATRDGEVPLAPLTTRLIPAVAGEFRIVPEAEVEVLVARPKFS